VKPATREIARMATPVSVEFMVMLLLNFASQIIVGGLGAVAIAAVGFANSLTFILAITFGAIGGSITVLAARAHGGNRIHELNVSVSVAIVVAVSTGGLATLVPFIWPHALLAITGASHTVADAGSDYLRLTALSLVPQILGAVLSGVLRIADKARSPMIATFITVILQTGLGYAFVFGFGPIPAMGVAGAGLASLIAAVLKALILWFQAFHVHKLAHWELPERWSEWLAVIRPLFVLAIPMAITELVWTVGIFLYNVVLQRLGDEVLAAAQISNGLEGFFLVGNLGLMTATLTLIGRSIGAKDPAAAVQWLREIKSAGIKTGLFFGGLLALSALSVNTFFKNTPQEVRTNAVICILISATVMTLKVRNMIVGGGVLPSGSDIRGVIMGDTIGAIVVGVPAAIILGLYTPLGLFGVFIARGLDELVKVFVYGWRARNIDWQALADSQADDTSLENKN